MRPPRTVARAGLIALAGLVIATTSPAMACDGPAPRPAAHPGQIAAAMATTLALTALSTGVLMKLYDETEPGGEPTLGWHLAAVGTAALHLGAGITIGMAGTCGSGPEESLFPILAGTHVIGLVATLALPLIWHLKRTTPRSGPTYWTLAPTLLPTSTGGSASGLGLALRW